VRFRLYVFLYIIASINVYSQNNQNNQKKETIKRADLLKDLNEIYAESKYPEGITKAQLTVRYSNKKIKVYKILIYHKNDNILYTINSTNEGRILKILYNKNSLNYFIYDIINHKLYQKDIYEKLGEVLNSAFSFDDLSNRNLSEKYVPIISELTTEKDKQYKKIKVIPADEKDYSHLFLYRLSKDKNRLEKIEYFKKNRILSKIIEFKYGNLTMKEKNNKSKIEYPIIWKAIDIKKETVSILEFFSSDNIIPFEDTIFDPDKLTY